MALRVHDFDSSAIARAADDDGEATLDLWYRGGESYRYFEAPLAAFQALVSAASAGEFVNREIKPNHRCDTEGRRRRFRPD